MQLVAYGAQDIYLTGNPQITFFKVVYRRHTNFSMETISQTLDGNATIGTSQNESSCTISRNGDLIHKMYVVIPSANSENLIYGSEVVQSAELEIGGQRIDYHTKEWNNLWNELTLTTHKALGLRSLIAEHPVDSRAVMMQIPLNFYFCRNPGLALPLIALQYHEVKINFVFGSTSDTSGTSGIPIKFFVDYIYLDTDERKRFAQVSHEYLIEQVQIQSMSSDVVQELTFNHPVKELIWLTDINYNYNTALLKLNGHDRFEKQEEEYFQLRQPFDYHTAIPRINLPLISRIGELDELSSSSLIIAPEGVRNDSIPEGLVFEVATSKNIGNVAGYIPAGYDQRKYYMTTLNIPSKITAGANLDDLDTSGPCGVDNSNIDLAATPTLNLGINIGDENATNIYFIFNSDSCKDFKPDTLYKITFKTHSTDHHDHIYNETTLEESLNNSNNAKYGFLKSSNFVQIVKTTSTPPVKGNNTTMSNKFSVVQFTTRFENIHRLPLKNTGHSRYSSKPNVHGEIANKEGFSEWSNNDLNNSVSATSIYNDLGNWLIGSPTDVSNPTEYMDAENAHKSLKTNNTEWGGNDRNNSRIHSPLHRALDGFQYSLQDGGGITHQTLFYIESIHEISSENLTDNVNHSRCSRLNKKINVYSFALKPEEHQPSGTCNFSRIDTATLEFGASPSGFTNGHIYAVNYNVLRIMSGMGGLAYSN